jgi:hypothetical protein
MESRNPSISPDSTTKEGGIPVTELPRDKICNRSGGNYINYLVYNLLGRIERLHDTGARRYRDAQQEKLLAFRGVG